MKAVVCEVCGSLKFVKQDGLYVCEDCGMKYTVEAMSALVQEVPDDTIANAGAAAAGVVPGSAVKDAAKAPGVKPADLEKLYQSAREARDSGDAKKAAAEYEMLFTKDPSSWEAAFYGTYFRAKDSTIYQIRSASYAMRNSVSTSLKLIRTHVGDRSEQITAVQDVAVHATEIANMLYDKARSHYDSLEEQAKKTNKLVLVNDCSAAKDILYGLGNDVDTLFNSYPELNAVIANAWKDGVDKQNGLMQWYDYKEVNRDMMLEYIPKIQKYDSDYKAPAIKDKKRGCYVATAVYGSYDCPEVWTLRRFRDDTLAETRRGRVFIRFYYAVSPTLVKRFGNAAWFRRLWKPWLDRLVARLNAAGVAGTPYQDR